MRQGVTVLQVEHPRGGPDVAAAHEVAQLKAANRQLAGQVESLRRGASAVLNELDTNMLARAVARQAVLLLHAEQALVELYVQDLPYLRTEQLQRTTAITRDLSNDDGVNSLSAWAVRHRQSILFDAEAPSAQAPCADLVAAGCRNAICVPMLNHQG